MIILLSLQRIEIYEEEKFKRFAVDNH